MIEFYAIARKLGLGYSQGDERSHLSEMRHIQDLFHSIDTDNSGAIGFSEFKEFILKQADQHVGKEGENAPETSSEKQRVAIKSVLLIGAGTMLVLLFSDPLVEVFSIVGDLLHISPFYISFIMAPLASNSSEFIAAYYYAKKKTNESATLSLSTLQGAAIMNNTFCLSIFLALIYFRGLRWNFAAETFAILLVELVIAWVSMQNVQTLSMGYLVISMFPISLVLVAILQAYF